MSTHTHTHMKPSIEAPRSVAELPLIIVTDEDMRHASFELVTGRMNMYEFPHSWLKALLFTGFVSSCCRSAVWLPTLTSDWLSEASQEILNQTCHCCWSRHKDHACDCGWVPIWAGPPLAFGTLALLILWYCASISFEAVSSLLWVATWNVKKKKKEAALIHIYHIYYCHISLMFHIMCLVSLLGKSHVSSRHRGRVLWVLGEKPPGWIP